MERIKSSLTLIITGVVGLFLLSNGIETLNDPYIESLDMGFSHTIAVWFGIIGGGIGKYAYSYTYSLSNALFLVFISGLLFLVLSIVPVGKEKISGKWITLREKIFDGMPECIRKAIPVGIGLFIAFIGQRYLVVVYMMQMVIYIITLMRL